MHPYVERLQEALNSKEPYYGYRDAHSILEMLYMWYVEWNPVNSEEIQKNFFSLEPYWKHCTEREKDDIFQIVSSLCQQHKQLAFLEGIRVGFHLFSEL